MIIDATQLLHFKVVLGVTNRGSGLSERHVAHDIVNCQEETRVIRDVEHVHLVVIIKLEELHRVALQNDLLLHLLADPLHVHVVVLLILLVDFIDAGEDLR
jgi:hypothetical protein